MGQSADKSAPFASRAAVALAVCAALSSSPGWARDAGDLAGARSYVPASRAAATAERRYVPEFRDLFARWRSHDALHPAPILVRVLTEQVWVAAEANYAVGGQSYAFRAEPMSIPHGLPVAAQAMTSSFGWRAHPILGVWRQHSGIDLAAPFGSPVIAPSDGVVSAAGWNGGYGLMVALEHSGGLETRYGHMSQLAVVPGQYLRRGDVIGFVGSTGLSTGPHLHYEIRINGRAVDPVPWSLVRKP